MDNVEKEFEEVWFKIKEENDQKHSITFLDSAKFIFKKEIYFPMILLTFLFFLEHFTGTTTLAIYAVNIFSSLKTPIDEYYATVTLAIMQIIGIIICTCFINLVGKRVITFISLTVVGICFLIAAIYVFLYQIFYLEEPKIEDHTKQWIPVIVLLISSLAANAGVVNLPWILTGEVFPNEHRAKASGIAAAIAYVINFVANKIFPGLVALITLPGIFLLYSLVSLFGIVFIYFMLPETEGKTLHEISDHFKGSSKLDNKVKRKNNGDEIENTNEDC